jgi:hypothetical protein
VIDVSSCYPCTTHANLVRLKASRHRVLAFGMIFYCQQECLAFDVLTENNGRLIS